MKAKARGGARHLAVERVQRALAQAGHPIGPEEVAQKRFGPSTLAALQAFQAQHGLRKSKSLNQATLDILLAIERRMTANRAGSSTPQATDARRGNVSGSLVDGDGAPIAKAAVELFSRQLRKEQRLGRATTSQEGTYSIDYRRPSALNLVVRAYGPEEKVIAESPLLFAAPTAIEIDLTTAADGVARQPSRLVTVQTKVGAQLHGAALESLQENKQTHDISFVASSASVPFTDVANLYIARRLSVANSLAEATLFGLFAQGVPATLRGALLNLPDAGIDETFTTKVMRGVLAQNRDQLTGALNSAMSANVIPASYGAIRDKELSTLDAVRVKSVASAPFLRGKTPLSDLLAAGSVSAAASTAFMEAYANSANLDATWKLLRSDKTLKPGDLTTLQTTLSAGELLGGNLPLVKDTLSRLAQGSLPSLPALATLDQGDWAARIGAVDPEAKSIPPVLPTETVQQRIARLSKALADRFSRRFAAVAFGAALGKSQTSAFTTKKELAGILTASANFNLKTSHIDRYVRDNKVAISPGALAELKVAQRLYRLSPHYATVEALKQAGYLSARSIYEKGRAPFLAQMTNALGSARLASAAYERAKATHAAALTAFGTFNASMSPTALAAVGPVAPDPSVLVDLPTLQALFGSLDFCQCSDCRSVLSPAAYLVDLLQFLGQRVADKVMYQTARDALFGRRPDLQYIALNCNNTNVRLPYIDVANEIFEGAIAPPTPPVTVIDTTGTSEERRALPQNLSAAAYTATASAVYPFVLPFDLPFTRTSAYLAGLGSSRAAVLSLFRGTPVGSIDVGIACASLGINPAMQAVINGSDGHQLWERWGLAQNPTCVIDPKTREPYTPTPGDWIAALNRVPVLMARSSLTLDQLRQLLEVRWVTAGGVTLQLGVVTTNGQQIETCDTDAMTFTGLTSAVLDRAQRFLRLWTASGITLWELDWALDLAAGGTLDDNFLTFLGGALAVRTALNLPLQEALSFWGPMSTRDVTNHLGDEDVVAHSTYSSVFRSPTLRVAWGAGAPNPVFVDASSLSGSPITFPTGTVLTPAQAANANAITAALSLSSNDISAILTFTGATNTLSLATLNVLLRYARLASALSLDIDDLILWIQLTGGKPFDGTPNDTLEFLRRLKLLRAMTLTVRDLDYLLRHQSASQTALAFTTTQSTAVLQTIRDAVAKLVQPDPVAVQTLVVQSLVAATGASSSIVEPVVQKTGILPLSSATIAQLIAQGTSVNPTLFPALINAFTTVAKAAALFNGLHATEAEFNFLLANAGVFNWLDAGALPVASTAASPYRAFEAFLRALQLNGRQPALTPKLFDVLAKWIAATPASVAAAIDADFAFSLDSNISDVSAIAAALGATAPSLTAATQSGSLADVALLSALASALDVSSRYKISGATLVQLAAVPATPDTAAAATGVFQSQYAARTWLGAVQIVEDKLRQSRRDALVAYLLAKGASTAIAASNAAPIVLTTGAPHGLQTGMQVSISGVTGNTAANGTATITVITPTSFSLNGSAGNAPWAGGGTVALLPVGATVSGASNATPISITTTAPHGFQTGAKVTIDGAQGNTAANGTFTITVTSPTTFTLDDSVGNGAWTAGGSAALAMTFFLQTLDDVYNCYLIDPGMCACSVTTRLLQASLSVQQFVQQCFLNLVPQVKIDSTWDPWSWMSQFRLWQANRQVFLYPENYLLPELRMDKSPFFADLENDLRQTNCDAAAATTAFESYLRKLVEVSRLVVGAHYHELKPDGTHVLHVFAHTRGTPPKWYYRTRSEIGPGQGTWSPWQPVPLDIASDHLLPTIWDQRLYLVWPTFKKVSEKPADQTVPTTGSGSPSPATVPPARTFWAISFAFSELRAGQWQPKRSLAEKMYFNLEDPPVAFTFKAYQDPQFNLRIEAYYNYATVDNLAVKGTLQSGVFKASKQPYLSYDQVTPMIGLGILPMPDAALAVQEIPLYATPPPWPDIEIVPDSSVVDLSEEPSYPLINVGYTFGGSLLGPPPYHYAAQDLIYRTYQAPNPGSVPLTVFTSTATLTLLGSIVNPRMIVPQQDSIFDSQDPFFISDPNRTFFVEPHYFTTSNPPQEITTLGSRMTWTTSFALSPFYHPYATTFLRELEIGGVNRLMERDLQLKPETRSGWSALTSGKFQALYAPSAAVTAPFPLEEVEFDIGGTYSMYNWEVFYFAPMFVVAQLMQNGQYQDAMTWIEHIINPTDSSGDPTPARYWQTKPFNQMHAQDWLAQQIDQILANESIASNSQAIADWIAHPYDPHRVAELRPAAYAKAAVMKLLDNLIAWARSYYAQYTAETVGAAEQLLQLASLILGPKPEEVRVSNQNQPSNPDQTTYALVQSLLTSSAFSDPLVDIENLILTPVVPLQPDDSATPSAPLPQLPTGGVKAPFFCIPPNDQLLSYWETVSGLLYNIRHCLNMQGVPQPLPLYAPPINPLDLIQRQLGGVDNLSAPAFAPIYRFATYLQKAVELASDVRSYGALVLAALEKKDAEALALLRANQELDIQTKMLDVKNLQVTEAQDQIAALNNQRAVVQVRQQYYSTVKFINPWEAGALELQAAALINNGMSVVLDLTASIAHLVPTFSFGVEGFGGSPAATASYGGSNIASAASAWAGVARTVASILSEAGAMSATMGSYQRRQDEWTLQLNLANAEITQLNSQIAAATDRLGVVTNEQSIQVRQIANAQAVSDFLTGKYTNAQLYDWLLGQLTAAHTQAYQLAVNLAMQAQAAYRFELGNRDTFIQTGYWDGQHRGLTAGESLLLDVRRMEAQYLTQNALELELTKNVSLALTQPTALLQLLQTGTCQFSIDESLLDADHPGLYFRRLRHVAITIPHVSGPYTGLNAILTLNSAAIRVKPPTNPYTPAAATAIPATADFVVSNVPATAMIATSTGQNDSGRSEASARADDRLLQFECLGAISTWTLQLDPRDNQVDLSTVSDAIITTVYTARAGGDAQAVRAGIKPQNARAALISVRHTFSNAYSRFFNPDSSATQQVLTLPLPKTVFPFSNLGEPKMTSIDVYFALAQPAPGGTTVACTFGPVAGAASNSQLTIVPGNTGAGGPIPALGMNAPIGPPIAPQPFALTVRSADVPPALAVTRNTQTLLDPAKIEDILLIVGYSIS